MDRFQILKGITPPPLIGSDLKGSIPIDIEIFGEEYRGSLIFLHKNLKHAAIEFTVDSGDVKTLIKIKEDLIHSRIHFHRLPGCCVLYISIQNVTTWKSGAFYYIRLKGSID
jgi:hypothetical protein